MKDTTTAETKAPTELGTNRTGISASPVDSAELEKAAREGAAQIPPDGIAYVNTRLSWASGSGPVGSMPPPLSLKGVAKTAVEAIRGRSPNVFLDKLGERLAFERTGVRLYEALLVKLEAGEPHVGGPTREQIESIRGDELCHLGIVKDAIEELGADSTAMTPCADVIGVASQGAVQVLADPRTTLTQCLDVMLMIELTDNACWDLLSRLAAELGHDEMARRFDAALAQEQAHAALVNAWVQAAVRGQAGIEPTPSQAQAAKGEAA